VNRSPHLINHRRQNPWINSSSGATHGCAFQLPRINNLPTSTVVFGPRVVVFAEIDWSDPGTMILPMSLPKVVLDVPSEENPRRKAGGIRITVVSRHGSVLQGIDSKR
jgi:hypothetical protein